MGIASATSRLCASEPFTLSVTNATKAGGITYQWQRSDAGTGVWQPISGATSAIYTVTNQTVSSDYRFIVTCTNSSGTVISNVVTVSQTVAGVFYENFNNTSTGTSTNASPPACWSYLDNHSGYGYTSTTAGRTGNGFYVYSPVSTGDLKLISPITNNLGNGTKQVRFWAKVSSASYSTTQKFGVYTMNGNTGTATKTLVEDKFPLTTTWQEFIVPLPVTTDDYFAFSFDAVNGTAYVYLDDVYYEDLSTSCGAPVNLNATNVTATGATIGWNISNNTTVSSYTYEVRTSGAAGSGATGLITSGTTTNATTASFNLTGLSSNTAYTVYIRSNCGATNGSWTVFPLVFRTPCVTTTVNFYENFDALVTGSSTNPTIPSCWSYLNNSSGYGYTTTTATRSTGGKGFYTYTPTNNSYMLISPETVNLGSGTKQIRFWAKVSSASYVTTQNLEIYTMNGVTGTASKTLLQTSIPLTLNWQEFIVPLPVTTDDYFAFSFGANANGATYVYLDDVYYEDLTPCIFPTNITISNIAQTAATISWTPSAATGVTAYEYEVRSSGAAGSGATGLAASGITTNATTTTANITGLSVGTYYMVYVRSVCGASSGIWTTFPANFNTLCGVVNYLYEGFESTAIGSSTNNTYPLCWSYVDTVTSSGYGYVSTSAANNGNNGFYTYRTSTTGSSYDGDVLLISPETNNLGNGAKRVRFWAKVSSASYATTHKFEVYSMNGTTSTSTKTLLNGSIALTASWQEFIVNLPVTTDDYFAFSFDRNGGISYVYLDDIYYEDIPPPTLTTTQTNNLCYGGNTGMASVVVANGAAPLTYSWSPSGGTTAIATGLTAGVYTVTVTDGLNRTATATVTITEPDEILANATINQITCNGANNGSISIAPTGGTFPYTYLWSDGSTGTSLSNLVPGVYSVTITDINGCFGTQDITITEPLVLTTSGTQVDVSVYKGSDGSATVTASGGTVPYTYLWSNGATTATASGLVAGNYTVTVTDANGCTATQTFVITQPIPLMIQSVSQTNVSCNGGADGSVALVVIGANAPYTYQWSPTGGTGSTATGLSAGTYTVLITEATGDTLLETFTITEPNALVSTISKTDITCNFASNGTATVSVTGGTAPYTYFWSNGMTTATATNLNVGNYSVMITDANGCTATSTVSISQPSALVVTPSSTNITCYGLNDGTASVAVTGGVAPYSYLWSNGQVGNSLSGLSQGTYLVTITDANGCSTTQSFTITEPAFVYPPVAANQSFCIGQNATLSNMVISGSNIKWYSAASGGVLLPATTVLTNGTTYYATQTIGTCESATRTAVQVTLNQGTPLTTTQISVCSNTRIQNMTIDGFNYTQLKWYSSATSTAVLAPSLLLTNTTYYVSSVTGTCESARQAIQVTVAAAVPAPTASSQVACGNSTLNDLVVSKDPSATLKWYSSMQSMIPLVGTTQVSTGTYYVQQVIGSCESVRIPVSVQVISVSTPTMTSITTCSGNTIADLHPSTGTYVWYLDNTTTTSLPDSFVITSGTYYIAHEVSGCISSRVNVAVTVNARPGSPTGQTTQLFGFTARVSDLVMNQPNVSWFASYNDAVKQVNQLSVNHVLQDQATYYGILTNASNCGSLIPTAVKVTINLSNDSLDLTALKYYPNPVDSELNISYIEEIKKVEVFTITGQRVFGNAYQGNEVKVDLSRLSSGTYLVKIETAKASQFVKVVKK